MAPPPQPRAPPEQRPINVELPSVLSDGNARLAAARRLTSRKGRRETGRFLAEGAQAVGEALHAAANGADGVVVEVFATATAADRHRDLLDGVPFSLVSDRAAAELSETVHPQGLVAVCRAIDVPFTAVFDHPCALVVGLVAANDPGNAGTILRTADAAGADAVVFAGAGVDVYNGKCVRASAGSIFHLDVVADADPLELIDRARLAGVRVLATTGAGPADLDALVDDGSLTGPTLWLFGNEAHGLPADVLVAADLGVRVPIHGRAESLNLSAAAAVCLYASARARRHSGVVNVVDRPARHATDAGAAEPREIGSPN